jgi:hypothetical protein
LFAYRYELTTPEVRHYYWKVGKAEVVFSPHWCMATALAASIDCITCDDHLIGQLCWWVSTSTAS